MGLCKLIVIVGVAALCVDSSNSASISGQDNLCICTREYFPVCATNGVTYSNKCVFECEKRTLSDLAIKFYGECDEQAADDELCMCTREYEPVCGSDLQTYSNKCTFKCAQKNNHDLKVSSFGECPEVTNLPLDQEIPEVHNLPMDQDVPEVQQFKNPCVCFRNYAPVCGSDGKTYSNKCMLNCAKFESKPELKMLSNGVCPVVSTLSLDAEQMCPCPRIFWPVCGSNGKTYSNKCLLECAQKTNKQLELFAEGECK